ncbi:MAG: response regulator [Blastocatellia bacterium]|nr:response regulator [Blastocatellia bacterium]
MVEILIVDDDIQVREVLKILLSMAGYTVREATTARKAIESYKQQPSDLIITDILMPDKDGLELIREVRRIHPDAKIIAMSGGGQIGSEEYLSWAKKFGAKYHLSKPIPRKELLKAVETVLNA